MGEAPGLSGQYRTASPWPVFTVLRIPISELGLLFGLFPLVIGGLLLFGGSVIDILKESGYVTSTIHAVTTPAVVLLAFSTGLAFTDVAFVIQGCAVIAATILLAVGGVVFELLVHEQRQTF